MKLKLIQYIFSKAIYVFKEFDFKNIKIDCENIHSVTFEKFDEKDYKLLDNTLKRIKNTEQRFTIDKAKSRIENGHMLYVAKANGNIIGFFWLATKCIEVQYLHASIYLSQDEIVAYNFYMLEEHRGKSIFNKLSAYAYHDLEQKGYKRAFCYIESTNKISLRVTESSGYRVMGHITSYIILTLEFKYHNLLTVKIVFHGGPLRLWKGLFRKIKETYNFHRSKKWNRPDKMVVHY